MLKVDMKRNWRRKRQRKILIDDQPENSEHIARNQLKIIPRDKQLITIQLERKN